MHLLLRRLLLPNWQCRKSVNRANQPRKSQTCGEVKLVHFEEWKDTAWLEYNDYRMIHCKVCIHVIHNFVHNFLPKV